jgi:hypothetical protein
VIVLNEKKGLQLLVESHGEAESRIEANGRQLESGVHESLMLRRSQGGGEYSPRWSLLYLCRIFMRVGLQ